MKFGSLQKFKKLWIDTQEKGKYIFDFLEDDMSLEAIKKKKHSIIANVNDNLTKLAHKGVKLPSKLSTYHARYSAASFISRETGASIRRSK